MTRRQSHRPKPWTAMRFSHRAGKSDVYGNDRYTVTLTSAGDEGLEGMVHLSIHNHSRSATGAHDWRHFQRIKNELLGPEREAVELFPAESRLVDTSNEFHLWVAPEGFQFPFGFTERSVADSRRDYLDTVPDEELEPIARDLGVKDPATLRTKVRRRSKQRRLG